MNDPGDKT